MLLDSPLPGPLKHWVWEHVLNPYTIDPTKPRTAKTTFGCSVSGTTRDFVFQHIWTFGVWEPNLTRYMIEKLRPGDVYVDVGGNIGYFALLGATCVGTAGRVVTIEPFPPVMATLRSNLALNGVAGVRTVAAAAGARAATMPFYVERPADPGGGSLVPDPLVRQTKVEVPVDTLAVLLDEYEIARTRLIKIDVEGGEVDAVAGMTSMLDRLPQDAQIIVEVMPANFQPIEACLAPFGFIPYLFLNPFTATDSDVDERARPLRSRDGRVPEPKPRGAIANVVFARVDAAAL